VGCVGGVGDRGNDETNVFLGGGLGLDKGSADACLHSAMQLQEPDVEELCSTSPLLHFSSPPLLLSSTLAAKLTADPTAPAPAPTFPTRAGYR
jgi:hypothetical protein